MIVLDVIIAAYILGHTPGGFEVDINTRKIISMHRAKTEKNRNVSDQARCVIHTEDGRFTSVTESCAEIHRMIEQKAVKP